MSATIIPFPLPCTACGAPQLSARPSRPEAPAWLPLLNPRVQFAFYGVYSLVAFAVQAPFIWWLWKLAQ